MSMSKRRVTFREIAMLEPIVDYFKHVKTIDFYNVLAADVAYRHLKSEHARLQEWHVTEHSNWKRWMAKQYADDLAHLAKQLQHIERSLGETIAENVYALKGHILNGCQYVGENIRMKNLRLAKTNFNVFSRHIDSVLRKNETQAAELELSTEAEQHQVAQTYRECRTKLLQDMARLVHHSH